MEAMKNSHLLDANKIDHKEFRNVINKNYNNKLTERESLKLVLSKCVDVAKIKIWVYSDPILIQQYTASCERKLDFNKSEKKIIAQLSERIYYFRCSIAHAKGDLEEYITIPQYNEATIERELYLMQKIAFQVLKYWSNL